LPAEDQAVVDALGVHTWQAFVGLVAPEAYVVPPMSQLAEHAPLTQIWPEPQLVPVLTFDQAVVDEDGVQTWQAFAGLTVPDAYAVPPM
jgi:hypothetical protein